MIGLSAGLFAVFHRDEKRSFFQAADEWADTFLSLKLFFISGMSGKTRAYHEWVGSGRTAGWRCGVGQDWVPTELFAQATSLPRSLQRMEDMSLENLSRGTNERSLSLSTPKKYQGQFVLARRRAGQKGAPTGRVAQILTVPDAPPSIVESCLEIIFASMN